MGTDALGTAQTISFVGHLRVRPEHEQAFLDHVAATVSEVLANEPGTILYAVHGHPTEPHTFFFIERYRDDDALRAHAESPHLADAVATMETYLAAPVEVTMYRQVLPA
jgi:quinol monooxygenase YgiN